MSDKAFVDTNILIYAYDVDAGAKHATAADVLRRLWHDGYGVLSTQVLQEFYVNATAKIPKPITPGEARAVISRYLAWPVEANTADAVIRASEIQERHRLSFWDALIIVAAVKAGAVTLLSEDLNHGQVIEGVKIVNPFLEEKP
jgi:predicted nucleic acid-binding protein